MKPIIKIQQIALSLTLAILLSLWIIALDMKEIMNLHIGIKIIGALISALSSIGIYRILISLLSLLLENILCFKKWVYGADYLEGTWIGFYIGAKGLVRYMIEEYEQGLDGLIIRGKSFDENLKYHTSWVSTSSNVDSISGRVSFMYETYSIKDDKNNNGIAFFNFERENRNDPPTMLIGFSSDLFLAGKRLPAIEIKLDKKVSMKQALDEAVKFHQENKEYIFVASKIKKSSWFSSILSKFLFKLN